MRTPEDDRIMGGYCYGPADLNRIEKGDSMMWLQLSTVSGDAATALYEDCVYWRLEKEQTGLHIPLVEQLTADELLKPSHYDTLNELKKNSDNVENLLKSWEKEGLKFYLHYGVNPGSEYLVVAGNLKYREEN